MIDLEKTLLDICLPLVDDQKALSVKTMATTNENEILLYVYANSEDVAYCGTRCTQKNFSKI